MFMNPMLMLECEQPFDDEGYLFEPMIDGHRLQLSFIGNKAVLYTRHCNDVTRQYPELHNVPLTESADIVLDGEVAYMNPDTGAIEFQKLIERYKMKKTSRIRDARAVIPVCYFVFDILYYNGMDMRTTPLLERKKLLDTILEENAYFKKMQYVEGKGMALFDIVKRFELEGVSCKRSDSLYIEGKTANWLKVKNKDYANLRGTDTSEEVKIAKSAKQLSS